MTGSTSARGYDGDHRRLRRQWAEQVATGTILCWRCGLPIQPTDQWDLGHDDHDRTIYRGPEHANRCNRSAAGRHRPTTTTRRQPEPHPGVIFSTPPETPATPVARDRWIHMPAAHAHAPGFSPVEGRAS